MKDDPVPRALSALLAEDEVFIRLDVAQMLEAMGLEVTEVATAEEGVALIRKGARFDLVITDINMPGKLDGLDLAEEVRRLSRETKIVVMSGKVSPDDAVKHLYDLFISKPFVNLDNLEPLMGSAGP